MTWHIISSTPWHKNWKQCTYANPHRLNVNSDISKATKKLLLLESDVTFTINGDSIDFVVKAYPLRAVKVRKLIDKLIKSFELTHLMSLNHDGNFSYAIPMIDNSYVNAMNQPSNPQMPANLPLPPLLALPQPKSSAHIDIDAFIRMRELQQEQQSISSCSSTSSFFRLSPAALSNNYFDVQSSQGFTPVEEGKAEETLQKTNSLILQNSEVRVISVEGKPVSIADINYTHIYELLLSLSWNDHLSKKLETCKELLPLNAHNKREFSVCKMNKSVATLLIKKLSGLGRVKAETFKNDKGYIKIRAFSENKKVAIDKILVDLSQLPSIPERKEYPQGDELLSLSR